MYEKPNRSGHHYRLGTNIYCRRRFGSYLGGQASHWVGAAETDANGVLFFNWATDGGDLSGTFFWYARNASYSIVCVVSADSF